MMDFLLILVVGIVGFLLGWKAATLFDRGPATVRLHAAETTADLLPALGTAPAPQPAAETVALKTGDTLDVALMPGSEAVWARHDATTRGRLGASGVVRTRRLVPHAALERRVAVHVDAMQAERDAARALAEVAQQRAEVAEAALRDVPATPVEALRGRMGR